MEGNITIVLICCYIVLAEKRRDSNASTVNTEKRLAIEKPTVTIPEPRPLSASSASLPTTPLPTTPTNVSYNLGHIGAGGNAIAAAASQAIAATQQVLSVMKVLMHFLLFTIQHMQYDGMCFFPLFSLCDSFTPSCIMDFKLNFSFKYGHFRKQTGL
jgi:hypothetical protein